jgi:putative transposase
VKYALIDRFAEEHRVKRYCALLNVSRSGFYEWKNATITERQERNGVLTEEVRNHFEDRKRREGSPRVWRALRNKGICVSRKTVAKIMRQLGLRAKAARKYKATTRSSHALPVSENILKQDFSASRPNEKWVSDITYIWTDEGWLYLAAIVDLFTRRVVGWHVSSRMDAGLVMAALQVAIKNNKECAGVILHSDRGSQYCSHAYQELMQKNAIECSMSKKGDCYDNAAMESWNHSFKVEAILGEKFPTRAEAISAIFDYIEVYYNRQRMHSALGYRTPLEFEEIFNFGLSRGAQPSRSDLPLRGLN